MNDTVAGFDMSKALKILASFGVSPETLGPEKLEKLQQLTDTVENPQDVSPELTRQILDIFNVAPREKIYPKNSQKIGRNEKCRCGSGKKYKKCCGKN